MKTPSFESKGFKPKETQRTDYYAPDGTWHEESWCDAYTVPGSRLSLTDIPPLLTQIDEPGGRQSCVLTSQLNVWIHYYKKEPSWLWEMSNTNALLSSPTDMINYMFTILNTPRQRASMISLVCHDFNTANSS